MIFEVFKYIAGYILSYFHYIKTENLKFYRNLSAANLTAH